MANAQIEPARGPAGGDTTTRPKDPSSRSSPWYSRSLRPALCASISAMPKLFRYARLCPSPAIVWAGAVPELAE